MLGVLKGRGASDRCTSEPHIVCRSEYLYLLSMLGRWVFERYLFTTVNAGKHHDSIITLASFIEMVTLITSLKIKGASGRCTSGIAFE